MIKRRYLAAALLFLLINAALEATPKDVVISLGISPTSASPRNPGPYGTSELAELLESEGYRVRIVASFGDIDYAVSKSASRVIVVVIAPENLSSSDVDALVNLQSRGYSFLIAGENIGNKLNKIVVPLSTLICGARISLLDPASIGKAYEATERDLLVTRLPGGSFNVVPTGYDVPVAEIGKPASSSRALTIGELSELGERLQAGGISSLYPIAVSSSLQALQASGGYPVVGVACERPGQALVVLGDSTPFTNMALEKSSAARRFASDVFGYLAGSSRREEVDVVFINSFYAGNLSVAFKFHPSILLNLVASYYSQLESKLPELLGASTFRLAMLGVAAMMALASLPNVGVRGVRAREPKPRIPRPQGFLGKPTVSKAARPRSREALELCVQADGLLKKSTGVGLDDIRSNRRLLATLPDPGLAADVERLSELCAAVAKPSTVRRIYEALGLAPKDVEEIVRIVEKLETRFLRIS